MDFPAVNSEHGSTLSNGSQSGLNYNSRILIVGAGMSGMLSAMRLMQSGYTNITIYERQTKSEGHGEITRIQVYGAMCHLIYVHLLIRAEPGYCHRFPQGREIQEYLLRVAKKHQLYQMIRFNHEVASTEFISKQWHVKTTNGSTDVFDVVICATGVLHHPKLPNILGRESFQGESFHTACWNHKVELPGKRIAVIGTGATAVQVVPEMQRLSQAI